MSEPSFRKFHLHSEQFDGWLHAECGAGDVATPNPWVLGEKDFSDMPRDKRCARCSKYNWPYGVEREPSYGP